LDVTEHDGRWPLRHDLEGGISRFGLEKVVAEAIEIACKQAPDPWFIIDNQNHGHRSNRSS